MPTSNPAEEFKSAHTGEQLQHAKRKAGRKACIACRPGSPQEGSACTWKIFFTKGFHLNTTKGGCRCTKEKKLSAKKKVNVKVIFSTEKQCVSNCSVFWLVKLVFWKESWANNPPCIPRRPTATERIQTTLPTEYSLNQGKASWGIHWHCAPERKLSLAQLILNSLVQVSNNKYTIFAESPLAAVTTAFLKEISNHAS